MDQVRNVGKDLLSSALDIWIEIASLMQEGQSRNPGVTEMWFQILAVTLLRYVTLVKRQLL